MKVRDILILLGLIGLVLVLTVAEKYAERRRELREESERAEELRQWQGKIAAAFENRWTTLSGGLRAALDSIAQEVVASGVSQDSLAAVLDQSRGESVLPATSAAGAAVGKNPALPADSASLNQAASHVLDEYEKALAALPRDLNAYEKRIAHDEVASLVRARLGLSPERFDSLLKRATAQP